MSSGPLSVLLALALLLGEVSSSSRSVAPFSERASCFFISNLQIAAIPSLLAQAAKEW